MRSDAPGSDEPRAITRRLILLKMDNICDRPFGSSVRRVGLARSSGLLDFLRPLMIARGYRLGVAQRAVQLDVQLDELAALASAEDLEVLGLPARDADDGEAVGRPAPRAAAA